MQPFVILRILGQLLMIFSITMLPAVGVGLFYDESDSVNSFAMAFSATLVTGFLLWYPLRHAQSDLRLRDGSLSFTSRDFDIPIFRLFYFEVTLVCCVVLKNIKCETFMDRLIH